MGRESATGAANPAFNSTQDIDFNHEAELTHSGRYALATDERGGGILPPGASCSPTNDTLIGNGGIHAYRVDKLLKRRPASANDAFSSYARNSRGGKAIFRAPIRTKPQAALCTAHVFQQIPGQNRIFMGWYAQGTQVVDFEENANGTIDFKDAGYFIPENANQWVSHIFKVAAQLQRELHVLRRSCRLLRRRRRSRRRSRSTRSRCRRRRRRAAARRAWARASGPRPASAAGCGSAAGTSAG